MDAALMGKSAFADIRAVFIRNKIGHFIDKEAQLPQPGDLLLINAGMSHFQYNVRDNGTEVCIAAALSITVYRALDLGAAGLDRHERVGDGKFRIVMSMDPEACLYRFPDASGYIKDLKGHCPAIRIAKDHDIRARFPRLP